MSILNALVIGPGIGLLFFIVFFGTGVVTGMFSAYLTRAIFFGFIITGYAALWYGGIDVIYHYALRFLLFLSGSIPFRYAAFLDDATQRLFLRKVGGGYIFLHRLLLEHFSAKNESKP